MPLPDFDSLWNYDDPAATEEKFRELLTKHVEMARVYKSLGI